MKKILLSVVLTLLFFGSNIVVASDEISVCTKGYLFKGGINKPLIHKGNCNKESSNIFSYQYLKTTIKICISINSDKKVYYQSDPPKGPLRPMGPCLGPGT